MLQSALHCQCLHGHFMSMVYVKNKETTCMALCSNESKWVFPLDVSCVKQVLLFDICINSQQVQTCLKSMLSCWQCEILQHKWCHNELSHCRHNFNSNILQRAYILLYSGFLFCTFGRLALLLQVQAFQTYCRRELSRLVLDMCFVHRILHSNRMLLHIGWWVFPACVLFLMG